MKFTLSWLKDHLETEADLDAITDKLTRIGLEVEGVENAGAALAPFRVAKVLTAERHPQADKLQILSVDVGEESPVQVVCGAPNARAGMLGVFGPPGAYVPGSDLTLKVAAIRGVESRGMMCSVRELELGEEHDGIIELPAEAPVGTAYVEYAGLDDPVIEVAVTPNRQDCMGVRGIARDLAAAGLGTLKPLNVQPIEGDAEAPEVILDDPDGCPAYYAQNVSGVTNGQAPGWMQRRLRAIGQKPISTLVDITNYIMIDLGRPLHVFDRATLDGPQHVRRARAGEQFLALNGKTYTLDEGMTVIADNRHAHDLGGIMGGMGSGVQPGTTEVLIECAYFDPGRIAVTGQKLGLTSDARQRFERGVDPAMVEDGLAIATRMVVELCGGTPSRVTRAGTPPELDRNIAFAPERTEALAGMTVPPQRQRDILERLGFGVSGEQEWQVLVPSWRRDVIGTADLVEEVSRIEGFDRAPSTALPRAEGVARPTATREQSIERRLRRTAASRGFNEAVTWSFIGEDQADAFGGSAWILANPIADTMKAMRPSLLPGLLSAAARNQARGADSIRLFEVGRRYLAEGERLTVGLVMAGAGKPRDWRSGPSKPFDAFDAKAEALALLAAGGAPVDNLQVQDGGSGIYHPGQSARLTLGKSVLAEFGALHPRLLRQLDLDGPVVAAEIFVDAIPARRGSGRMRSAFTPPALQAVRRDFAFLVPAELAADVLLRAVRGADKAAITGVSLFDVFTGQGVPEGQKSLAIEVVLQPIEKSFTDEELKGISDRVVAAAVKLGASLRT